MLDERPTNLDLSCAKHSRFFACLPAHTRGLREATSSLHDFAEDATGPTLTADATRDGEAAQRATAHTPPAMPHIRATDATPTTTTDDDDETSPLA